VGYTEAMSERNTGLFVAGHIDPDEILTHLLDTPGVTPEDFAGDEAPRVGHGEREGHLYTHIALALFEKGGLLLLAQPELPANDELETHLGRQLSREYGRCVFLLYDDEDGHGGHALFADGELESRLAYDGRGFEPVCRDRDGEHAIDEPQDSDWIWPLIGAAVDAGATSVLGAGVRTDDDIESLITGAGAVVVRPRQAAVPPPVQSQVRVQDPGARGKVRAIFRRLRRK